MPFDLSFENLAAQGDVGATPQVDVPSLAALTRRIYARPPWQVELPIEVDAETYQKARAEMIDLQRRRGFPLATGAIGRVNFLLRGIPVVIKDQA